MRNDRFAGKLLDMFVLAPCNVQITFISILGIKIDIVAG